MLGRSPGLEAELGPAPGWCVAVCPRAHWNSPPGQPSVGFHFKEESWSASIPRRCPRLRSLESGFHSIPGSVPYVFGKLLLHNLGTSVSYFRNRDNGTFPKGLWEE